jgi:hypothetical protein
VILCPALLGNRVTVMVCVCPFQGSAAEVIAIDEKSGSAVSAYALPVPSS